jgi:exopolyphosphatase/guanosine-5'-triphosphate,3'-diphosphate pyrophosphatase
LVARPTVDGFQVIDAFSRIVRLGEGLGLNGKLSDAAMARAVKALRICASKMRRRRVTRWRTVATEACRRASNCDAFVEAVLRETGLELEIISTQEEAHLALYGCAPLLDPGIPHALVFDIGGGSTELMWLHVDSQGEPWCTGWTSLPLGVVTLAEHYGGHTTNGDQYDAMIDEVYEGLRPIDAAHAIGREVAAGRVQMLGTSGTVTTVAGVHLRLPRYNRAAVDGVILGFDEVSRVSRDLAAMGYAERLVSPCIGPERADLVVAGCAILAAICRMWPVGRLRVADRGIREGILLRMMQAADQRAHAGSAKPVEFTPSVFT